MDKNDAPSQHVAEPATPPQAGRDGVQQWRKKPVVIQAIEWTGHNLFSVATFLEGKQPDLKSGGGWAAESWDQYCEKVDREGLYIDTLEGKLSASIGDFIIRGVKGEFYACKPDIFEVTYERA